MNKRIILCAVLVLVSSVFGTAARPRKKATPKKRTQVEQPYYEEIDNFDFLYADSNDDFYYSGASQTADAIINEAMRHLGTPYRLGSKGPNTFDCSGFTSYVFSRNHFSIGNNSRDQYARNMPIPKSEAHRGDLVFFTSPNSGRSVGHVGIVVDVDPITQAITFIHASSKAGVKVSSTSEATYARRYVGVRRVF